MTRCVNLAGSLQNVCTLKRKIATRPRRTGFDRDYFLAMLKNNDPDLTTSVEYRGLGVSRLQVTVHKYDKKDRGFGLGSILQEENTLASSKRTH